MLCCAIGALGSENDIAGFELPIPCGGFRTTDCYSVALSLPVTSTCGASPGLTKRVVRSRKRRRREGNGRYKSARRNAHSIQHLRRRRFLFVPISFDLPCDRPLDST